MPEVQQAQQWPVSKGHQKQTGVFGKEDCAWTGLSHCCRENYGALPRAQPREKQKGKILQEDIRDEMSSVKMF